MADEILSELGLRYEASEVGNMQRFVDQHRDKVRFISERKSWTVWDGARWKLTSGNDVFAQALETARSIFDEARDCPTREGQTRLSRWAASSQTDYRINAMMKMASKHPDLLANVRDFDREHDVINCLNGIVGLRTGELLPRTSSDMVMKLAPVEYKPDATCPTFSRFLHDIFGADADLIAWMHRAIGYSLVGRTNEQLFFIAYGTGANGKSTLFETILKVLGDYGRAAEFDTFLATDRSNTRVMEGIAKLQGIRFALASETDSSKRFSEALVKKITGGDTVTGSHLYGASFEFRPEFKLWLLANHLPFAKDGSYGFWRRVKIVPFARQFQPEEMDKTLEQKLYAEREGIFSWCVRGAVNWFKHLEESGGSTGLGPCPAVDEATSLYKSDHDTFGQFIDACLDKVQGAETPAQKLYDTYQSWCMEVDEPNPCNQQFFGSRLQERGIQKRRKNTGNVYLNIAVKGEPHNETDF